MSNKNIAVVGAGTAGLIFAHKMLRMGNRVTVFSDRTADQILNHSPPTGSAYAYGITTDIEKSLDLNDYVRTARPSDGILFDFVPTAGAENISLAGKLCNPGSAVDLRIRVFDWIHQLIVRGGNFVVEAMTIEKLVQISTEFDDIFISAGKGDITGIFGRNDERPHYPAPQRKLTMIMTEGIIDWQERSHLNNGVRFNFFADAGEMFFVPYTHKSGRECYNILFEAKDGDYMDVFEKGMSVDELNDTARDWLLKHTPWDASNVANMKAISGDNHSTLQGAVPPFIRNDYGVLPNGTVVYPLGDAWAIFDPIGGQGINNGSRQTDFIADRYIELGHQSATREWAEEHYEQFYQNHTKWATLLNNLMLEPLDETGITTLLVAANNTRFTDEILFGQFHAPKGAYLAFSDPEYANNMWTEFAPYLNKELHLPDWVPPSVVDKLRMLEQIAVAA